MFNYFENIAISIVLNFFLTNVSYTFIITEISKVLTARLGIQNAQSHLINYFQNSLKSRGQKSWSFWSRDFVVFQCATYDV